MKTLNGIMRILIIKNLISWLRRVFTEKVRDLENVLASQKDAVERLVAAEKIEFQLREQIEANQLSMNEKNDEIISWRDKFNDVRSYSIS